MRVLVACEYSGRVRSAFRALGHDAWSCDLDPAADASFHHYQDDALAVMSRGCEMEGLRPGLFTPWDMVIAFPPCTYLCSSGLHWNARTLGRSEKTDAATKFFLAFTRLSCPWAIENPVGIMSSRFRKPDQIIQPYQFGDSAKKTTCLWLHKLKNLAPTNIVDPGAFVTNPDGRKYPAWMTTKGKHRSVTFPGIARAMAEQWGVV